MQYMKYMKSPKGIQNITAIENISRIQGMKKITLGVVILLTLLILLVLSAGCSSVGKHSCHLSPDGKCDSMSLIDSTKDGDKFYGYPINSFEGKPVRKGENVQQIWIGPYEDNDGNYHEPSYVYSITKKGTWIGEPVKEIQD